MQPDCPACTGVDAGASPVPDIPPAWEPIQATATALAPWIPTDGNRGHLRRCSVCGTLWLIGWNPRDSLQEGLSRIPANATALLVADADPADVVQAGISGAGPRALVAAWVRNAPWRPEDMMAAVGKALAGHHGVLDAHAIEHCLGLLHTIAARGTRAAGTLADNPPLLDLLVALPDRPRSVADRMAVRTSALTRHLANIARELERIAPAAAARLRAVDSPERHRERALATLRSRLADESFPHELVLAALNELAEHNQSGLPFDEAHADLLLALLEQARDGGPGRSAVIARSLLVHLDRWMKAGRLPAARHARMSQALAAPAK